MDGKVLVTAFKNPPPVEPIESWDLVPGDAGLHSADVRLDPAASAEAFKQLVELGYVAPPAEDMREAVAECTRELKYNLARAYRDANCCGECAALVEELWERWPREHRFGILLIDCLGALRQVARRRVAIEELARRVDKFQAEAEAELERREAEKAKSAEKSSASAATQPADPAGEKQKQEEEARRFREQFEERQWRELAHGRPGLLQWLWVSQELQEKNTGQARERLRQMTEAEASHDALNQHMAGALAALGDREAARSLLEESLQADPENPYVLAQLASIHLTARRFPEAIRAAADSLSLMYFQPALHGLLGQALMASGRYPEAEQELKVAIAQSPRHLAAHELLGQLYRDHLNRPQDALAQEGRARSLRHELEVQGREGEKAKIAAEDSKAKAAAAKKTPPGGEPRGFLVFDPNSPVPPPFEGTVDPGQVITIVSGLPRSGTSLMMQLLAAGGLPVLTDARRAADSDNPLGYLEFEPAMDLARDSAWIPQARGKAVKIVAQLLQFLPPGEYYRIIFMERDLSEVLASQAAMLAREGRRGAALDPEQLRATYIAQVQRVRSLVASRPRARLLPVAYADLLANPAAGAERVAAFLGGKFDCTTAAAAVRPELRRQKA
jgi:predicted Zn-dependent protease